ncbi:MAG: hypothetical protein M3314_15500 [Actinomycetota bacterium]|nr:hypothetical protein [Actinomycetota bacterium]
MLFRPHSADVAAAGVLAGFSYPIVTEFLFLVAAAPDQQIELLGPTRQRPSRIIDPRMSPAMSSVHRES